MRLPENDLRKRLNEKINIFQRSLLTNTNNIAIFVIINEPKIACCGKTKQTN
jgi:hypothetical protein